MRKVLFGVALLALSAGAHAQVFKCVDAQGKVTFSQVPCPGQAAEKIEVRNNEIGGQFATEGQTEVYRILRDVDRDIAKKKREEAVRRQVQSACANISPTEVRTLIIRKEVKPGMKMSDVHKAWGPPTRIINDMHAWHFRYSSRYVFEKDGCAEKVE